MNYRFKKATANRQQATGTPQKEMGRRPIAYCLPPNASGFTLVELLVVMVIIGLLAALVVPRFVRQEEKAKLKAAQAQIELLGTALDTFRLDVGRYPTSQEGLEALRRQPPDAKKWDGPYLKKEVPLDPWGKQYNYESPGKHGPYDLYSYGADGAQGGDGDNRDITSWEG